MKGLRIYRKLTKNTTIKLNQASLHFQPVFPKFILFFFYRMGMGGGGGIFKDHLRENNRFLSGGQATGRVWLIRSHSLARISFKVENLNQTICCNSNLA